MTVHDEWKHPESPDAAHEGTYDAQLSFPGLFAHTPEVISTIVKRDGREAPFEKGKIAEAIFQAGQSVDEADRDRAESLASAVALYLAKHVTGAPPTVDQVNDAVERVLFELGHGKIALAFARYRDRRARIRVLRSGNLRAALHDLQDGDVTGESLNAPSTPSLFVRTSDDTLVAWDGERITDALVRETGLERERAMRIAAEVQEQIASARVETLTAPLVRELVDAKLVEHGLDAYRRRHMRLGVPLFDAERIICLPNHDEQAPARTPQATDLELAERVKREFALTQVFDREVGDAHLRGELHIHGLGYIDRLHGCSPSLEFVAQFGLGGSNGRARPPHTAEMLLSQAGQFASALAIHFTDTLAWQPIHAVLRPFMSGWSEERIQAFVRMFLLALVPARPHGRTLSPTLIDVDWTETSDDELDRQILSAIFDAWADDALWDERGQPPELRIAIHDDHLETPHGRELIARSAQYIAEGRSLYLMFPRTPMAPASSTLRDVSMGEVTLNMPRLAYRAGNESNLDSIIAHSVSLAAAAHRAKYEFIERLLAVRSFGPLGFLAAERQGTALFPPRKALHRVGILGLNECVEFLTGTALHSSNEATALGLRILDATRRACAIQSERTGLHLEPVSNNDDRVARRFASLDVRSHPEAVRQVVKSDPMTQDLYYTLGITPPEGASHTPFERVRLEGRFHDGLGGASCTRVTIPGHEMTPRSIADFIRRVARHTESHGVLFCTTW